MRTEHELVIKTARIKKKEEGRDHKSIQLYTTPDPGHHMVK